MRRNRNLITLAIIIIVIQLFAFFLPTFSEEQKWEDPEASSTQQLLINYTDTLNDDDGEDLWGYCEIGRFVTYIEYISAIIFLVCAIRMEAEEEKKSAWFLLIAASDIACACLINYSMLTFIFEESRYDKSVSLLFGGVIQLLGAIAVACISIYVVSHQYYASKPTPVAQPPVNIQRDENATFSTSITCPVCGQTGIAKNRRSCPKCDTIL